MGLGLFYYTQENWDILFGQTQHPRGMMMHGWVKEDKVPGTSGALSWRTHHANYVIVGFFSLKGSVWILLYKECLCLLIIDNKVIMRWVRYERQNHMTNTST